MHKNVLMRLMALCAFAGLGLCAANAEAAKLNTGDFTAACSDDPSVTDDPSFDDGKVTPKAFCECVAAALEKNNLSQKDVDMLTKMHNEELSDADAEAYPTLEDLMNANESYEDGCRRDPRAADRYRHRYGGRDPKKSWKRAKKPRQTNEAPAEEEAPPDDDGSPPE